MPDPEARRLTTAIEVLEAHDEALSALIDHVEVQSRLIVALFKALDEISSAKVND